MGLGALGTRSRAGVGPAWPGWELRMAGSHPLGWGTQAGGGAWAPTFRVHNGALCVGWVGAPSHSWPIPQSTLPHSYTPFPVLLELLASVGRLRVPGLLCPQSCGGWGPGTGKNPRRQGQGCLGPGGAGTEGLSTPRTCAENAGHWAKDVGQVVTGRGDFLSRVTPCSGEVRVKSGGSFPSTTPPTISITMTSLPRYLGD